MSRKTNCEKSEHIMVYSNIDNPTLEINDTPLKNNMHKCKYCNKTYSRNDSLVRHIRKNLCKAKRELPPEVQLEKINEKYPINNQLIDIIIDKSKAIEELKSKYENNQNTNDLSLVKNKESSKLVLNDIVIIARPEDNFVNATELCRAGNKKFNDWYRLDITKELIKELERYEINNINLKNIDTETNINIINSNSINVQKSDAGIPVSLNFKYSDTNNQTSDISDIETNTHVTNSKNRSMKKNDIQIPISQNSKYVDIKKGNTSKYSQGTWIHPDLAIQLAQWISPKFALQVSKWIRTLFISGSVSLENELKLKDKRIQLLQDSFIKKQKRINYPEKNVIYIVTTEDNKNKRIYIIGKATNLKQRLSGYNKTSEHEVIFYKSCDTEENMNLVELLVLNKLKKYQEKANRDRFKLPLEKDITLFTNIVNDCVKYIL
jgi:hypothetical protein